MECVVLSVFTGSIHRVNVVFTLYNVRRVLLVCFGETFCLTNFVLAITL